MALNKILDGKCQIANGIRAMHVSGNATMSAVWVEELA
jgi:hypothetical protein